MQMLANERLIFVARVTCCVQHMNTEKNYNSYQQGSSIQIIEIILTSSRYLKDEDGEDEQDDVDYNDSANALASAIGSCCLLDGAQ